MKFEKLFEGNCRISEIEDGDVLPVGGSFPGKFDLHLQADLAVFDNFFAKVSENAARIGANPNLQAWLNQCGSDFPADKFAHMYAFTAVLDKMYPEVSQNFASRSEMYQPEKNVILSEVVNNKACACAELAVLAQVYMQKQGFESRYCGGELLRSADDEFGEAHSFISFSLNGKNYIFDPANPLPDKSGVQFPRISEQNITTEQKKQFEARVTAKEDDRRQCAFAETKDILTSQKWYYGFGDKADIFKSFLFSRDADASFAKANVRE